MPTLEKKRQSSLQEQPWYRRLYLPSYRIGDVARYTDANRSTISYWHKEETKLLPVRQLHKSLSYMQLVEVAFVAFFRKQNVSMRAIRDARSYVAQMFGVEYPFVDYRWKTEGHHILMEYTQIDPNSKFEVLLADRHGQLGWKPMMGDKFAEFDYDYELALRWHPAGLDSSVVVDPRIAFGAPTVNGMPTWVIKGRIEAKETIEEMMDEYDLTEDDIYDAIKFEGVVLNSGSVLG